MRNLCGLFGCLMEWRDLFRFVFIHSFCVIRRVWRSPFRYAMAFPVRSPYMRSSCFGIFASSFEVFYLYFLFVIFINNFIYIFIYLLVEFANVFLFGVLVFRFGVLYDNSNFWTNGESRPCTYIYTNRSS